MKKSFFLGVLTFFLSLSSCTNEDNNSAITQTSDNTKTLLSRDELDPPKSGNVKTVWTLGRKSRLCHGIGLCKHEKTTITIGELPPVSFGDLQRTNQFYTDLYFPSDDELIMILDPISSDYVSQYFGGDRIILEEDLIIDNVTIGVEISRDFTISAGTYDFETDQNTGWKSIHVLNSNR